MKLSSSIDQHIDRKNESVARPCTFIAIPSTLSPTPIDLNHVYCISAIVTEARDNDVLCGKDKTYLQHPGNKQYRQIILQHATEYEKCKNKRRSKMTMTTKIHGIMTTIHKCRFLRRSNCGHSWDQLTASEARDKISHALRFMNKSGRKTLEKENSFEPKQLYDVSDHPNHEDTLQSLRCQFLNDNNAASMTALNSWMLGSTHEFLDAKLEDCKIPPVTKNRQSENHIFGNPSHVDDYDTKPTTHSDISSAHISWRQCLCTSSRSICKDGDATFERDHEPRQNNTKPYFTPKHEADTLQYQCHGGLDVMTPHFSIPHESSLNLCEFDFNYISPASSKECITVGSRKRMKRESYYEGFKGLASFNFSGEDEIFHRIFQMGYNACIQHSASSQIDLLNLTCANASIECGGLKTGTDAITSKVDVLASQRASRLTFFGGGADSRCSSDSFSDDNTSIQSDSSENCELDEMVGLPY
jgi:hypothetical protein